MERHAKATTAIVSITAQQGMIVLRVEDNGVGFDTNAADDSHGIGLRNIRERADHHLGSVTLASVHGRTELQVQIPIVNA
ncbi:MULTISPECIES: ATP-binding protein [Pseudomonas]|uniref:ATP-binding protein n=1 Tax=Pseudomonas TaxID=286 RepID=UPI00031D9F1E